MIDTESLNADLAECDSQMLQYIYDTQKDLYSEEELKYILKLREERLIEEAEERRALETESEKYLPKEIECPKCGGPNEFKNDTCKFCGAKFNKDEYYERALDLALGIEDEDDDEDEDEEQKIETTEGQSFTAQYIISFVLPFVGWIMGGILLTKEDSDQRSAGLNCIVIGIVSCLLSAMVFLISLKAMM